MPIIRLETDIAAPIERCFDLARDVGAHVGSTAPSGERAVAGVTSGLLGLGDEVTWEARPFGVRQRLTAKIVAFDRPRRFVDVMARGAFARFTHVHEFTALPHGTRMVDVFDYAAPFGALGRIAEVLVLTGYMRTFLRARNRYLKQRAEARHG